MSRIISVVNRLQGLKTFTPATESDVNNIRIDLHMELSNEYKEYLKTFCAILAEDVELTGFAKSKNRNVVQVTKREWDLNPSFKGKMYVVETVGIDGLIIWQDSKGTIFESSPGSSAKQIADSLAEYLETRINQK